MKFSKVVGSSFLALTVLLTGCDDQEAETLYARENYNYAKSGTSQLTLKVDAEIARNFAESYANIAYAVFEDAVFSAKELQDAIDTFLANPSDKTQFAAKQAWIKARSSYVQTEVFNIFNDDKRFLVNAWPINAGLIDYVSADTVTEPNNAAAFANIIASDTINIENNEFDVSEITADKLLNLNRVLGFESNVTTGFHVVEFLLWGQNALSFPVDESLRSYTDYLLGEQCTNGNCAKRGTYLKVVIEQLVADLEDMSANWQAESFILESDNSREIAVNINNYRSRLINDDPQISLHRILRGLKSVADDLQLQTLAALDDAPEQYYEFSNNQHDYYFYSVKGLNNVILGKYQQLSGELLVGQSLPSLLPKENVDNLALSEVITNDLSKLTTNVHLLVDKAHNGVEFRSLAHRASPRGNDFLKALIDSLNAVNDSIVQAGNAVGVDIN